MPPKLRQFVDLFKRTPLHPQWLLGRDQTEIGILQTRASGIVLDVGCFDQWVRKYLPADSRYIGLDYPITGMGMYQSRPHVFADASELPFDTDSIDTVVMFQTLEHVSRPLMAISENYRILRPDGALLLSVPFLYPLHDEPYDFTRFTIHGLTRELNNVGFVVEAIKPSLGSAETTGLLVCLNLAGMSFLALRTKSLSLFLIPFVVAAIPFINLSFWLLGKLFPSWDAMPAGYLVVARKKR